MPLPLPGENEEEKDFISRCMGDDFMVADFEDNAQRAAVCHSQWDKKESKEAKMVTKLSAKDKQTMLQNSLRQEYKIGQTPVIPKDLIVEEVYDDHVVYSVDGQLFKADYKLDEKGVASYSDPVKVTSTKVFKNMESLQTTYSELIQEAGKRNALKDAGRVKEILRLCQELLSSEIEPEEKKTKEALKEANSVLKLVKEQASVKLEDGESYPNGAFAYAPDLDDPDNWKLRLWESLEMGVTKAMLGRVATALSPAGFRGQKVAIPSAELGAVKRKIRAEYRKLDITGEDIPRQVKESWSEVPGKGTVWKGVEETRELILNYIPLTEAKIDKGRAAVIIIKPGFNESHDRYYPAEMLKRDYKIFEGQKMYADHPTEEEDNARPERSIRDWVATLSEVTVNEAGVVSGIAEVIEPWMMQKLANLREKDMLGDMGISINAIGSASKGTIEGEETLVIEELVACRSVDFVTEPGAGGIVTLYEADRKRDIDLVELATLKERRPDLIKAVEASVRAEVSKEVKKAMENEALIKEKDEQIATLTTERDELKEAADKALKEKAKAEAQATIKEAVDKAELPDKAKARLVEQFKDADNAEGITEAIDSMKSFIADLSETSKVKGLGPKHEDSEKDTKELRESLKRSNPDWTDEQLDVAVSGR